MKRARERTIAARPIASVDAADAALVGAAMSRATVSGTAIARASERRRRERGASTTATSSRRRVASSARDVASGVDLDSFEDFLLDKQRELCEALAAVEGDGIGFCEDYWERGTKADGYGLTRVLEGGRVFEKAAANVSIIRGTLTAERAKAMSSRGRQEIDPSGGQAYEACALSLVFHPRSPMVPTFRADVRRFRVGGKAWYGGGADLTPYYLFEDDASEFHDKYEAVCDAYDSAPSEHGVYEACKEWCDEYFYIPARREHRGVGGVFFDDLETGETSDHGARVRGVTDAEAFTRAIADEWLNSYLPIVHRRRDEPYGEAQERWHHQRRGRYIEFNLLYDRGVRFGLDGGRIEAIMVSAPPRVRWDYDVKPEPGSPESRLVDALRSPRAWASSTPARA